MYGLEGPVYPEIMNRKEEKPFRMADDKKSLRSPFVFALAEFFVCSLVSSTLVSFGLPQISSCAF
jgi:hypothetical protein